MSKFTHHANRLKYLMRVICQLICCAERFDISCFKKDMLQYVTDIFSLTRGKQTVLQNKLPFSVITVTDIFQSHLLNYVRFLFLEQQVGCANIVSNNKTEKRRVMDHENELVVILLNYCYFRNQKACLIAIHNIKHIRAIEL